MRNKKTWTLLALGSAMALATFGAVQSGVARAQPAQGQEQGSEQPRGAERAQSPQKGPGAQAEKGPTAEAQVAEVVRQIHAINRTEVEMGMLAAKRAEAPEIKGFAARMIKDHAAADKNLIAVAGKRDIDLNVEPTNPIVKAIGQAGEARDKRLHDVRAGAFDVAYIAPEASEHELALQIADIGIEHAQGDVKQMLEATRSMLTTHLDLARDLEKQLVLRPTAVGGGPSKEGHANPKEGQHGDQAP